MRLDPGVRRHRSDRAMLLLFGNVFTMAAASVPYAPPGSATVRDPTLRWALSRMHRQSVNVDGLGDVETCFYRTRPAAADKKPTVLFFHGGDSTCLEWSSVIEKMEADGVDCVAVDWWTGGWTERAPITAAIEDGAAPWDAIRKHLHAFWQQNLGGEPVHVVGTSMGGAVAIDFATSHPEAVAKLVLIDAGGESYAAPPPAVGSFLAPFCPSVLRLLAGAFNAAAKLPIGYAEEAYVQSLHRSVVIGLGPQPLSMIHDGLGPQPVCRRVTLDDRAWSLLAWSRPRSHLTDAHALMASHGLLSPSLAFSHGRPRSHGLPWPSLTFSRLLSPSLTDAHALVSRVRTATRMGGWRRTWRTYAAAVTSCASGPSASAACPSPRWSCGGLGGRRPGARSTGRERL